MTKTLHTVMSRAVMRVQHNSSQQNNLQQLSLSERIKPSVYAIFINVKYFFLELKDNKRDGERSPFPSASRGLLFLNHVMFAGGLASFATQFPSCKAKKGKKSEKQARKALKG